MGVKTIDRPLTVRSLVTIGVQNLLEEPVYFSRATLYHLAREHATFQILVYFGVARRQALSGFWRDWLGLKCAVFPLKVTNSCKYRRKWGAKGRC